MNPDAADGGGETIVETAIVPDNAALFRMAAHYFVTAAKEAVAARGRFDVALSGGSTPKGLYALLAGDAEVPWGQVHFFWGDERPVPPGHPDSNYRMANEALLSKVGAKPEQVWRIVTEDPDPAFDYERKLRKHFGTAPGEFPRFDLVLLGMGPEGHTASLFPGTKALDERERLAVSNWVGKLYTNRITLTPPVLNHAAMVMFLVSGADKAPALKAVLEGPYEPAQLPAQLIHPTGGRLVWLIDRTAGGMLKAL
jgi:6-phosphogluconolactonase